MPDLPRVEQSFTADVSDYVAKMQLMIDETERFAEEIDEAIGKIGEFKAALASLPDEVDIKVTLDTAGLAEQIEEIKTEVDALGKATIPITLDEDEIMEQVVYIREILSDIPPVKIPVELDGIPEVLTQIAAVKAALDDLNLDDFKTTVAAAATAMTAAGAAGEKAKTGIADAGAAVADTTWAWLSLTHGIQTFGGALTMVLGREVPLITSIAGWHLLLDGVAESVIALSGAFIALGAAAAGLAPSFLDIYTHLTATRDQIEAFGVEIKPFTSWFLNLQHAMQTQAIELYGEALLDLGKANGTLMTSIENVGSAIDRMGAKISEWVGTNTNFANTISKGAEYAKDLGDILGNLIVIIDELIRADSGIVNFVLDFFSGFTKVIGVILGFNETLTKTFLLVHGFLLWGGLLSSMLLNLAVTFLRPVANILAFVAGTKSATAAIEDFEAAQTALAGEEVAANPLQKMGIVLQTLVVSLKGMGTAIAAWAAEVGTSMAAAEGVVATGAAGIEGIWKGLIAVLDIVPPMAWLAAIAAGVAYLAYQTTQASPAVNTFISSLNAQVGAMTISQQVTQGMSQAITELDAKIASTNVSSELQNWGGSWQHLGDDARGVLSDMAQGIGDISSGSVLSGLTKVGEAIKGIFVPGAGAAQQATTDINAYQAAISKMAGNQKTLFQVAGTTMQQNGITFTQALGLMDAAGIKSGESFQEDMTQVNGLILGYKDLGEQGGVLQNNIDAVTFSAEQQESEISKITSAWTSFIGLITGGESSFSTFGQQILSIGQSLGATSTTLETSNGKADVSIKGVGTSLSSLDSAAKTSKTNIDGLSSASLNLKSSFISGITDASNQINSLMQLSSAAGLGSKGLNEISQAGKDMVAEMLPVAKGSQDATAMLYGLAQQAGYTGSDSFASLAQWVGKVANPMQNLENITNGMTVAAGNLAADTVNLSNAIDTDLDSAMALAVVSGSKTQKMLDDADAAVKNAHGDISDMLPSIKSLATSLLQDLGGNITKTKAELQVFLNAMGLAPGKVKQIMADMESYWAQANTNIAQHIESIQQEIDSLHGKTIQITTQYVTSGGTVPGVTEGIPTGVKAAAGYLVPGSGSGDTVPAMLSPGEAVVPKHLVSAIAPFMSANKVPGFASGGMVAPMLPPAPDLTGLAQLLAQLSADTSWADWNAAQPSGKITGPQTAGQNAAEGFQMAAWASKQLSGLQAMQAGGSTAGLASLLLPGTPLSTLAAGIPGIGIGAGALTSSSVSASTGADQVLHSHVSVNLDGQQIAQSVQKSTLKYNIRNNGVPTGLMKPK